MQSAHLAAGEISQVSGTTAEGMTDEIIQKVIQYLFSFPLNYLFISYKIKHRF
jgi:hypothetical protein